MSNTSSEEVIQRLRTLLEENAKVEIITNNDTTTTIKGKGVTFNLQQSPPNTINRTISRLR